MRLDCHFSLPFLWLCSCCWGSRGEVCSHWCLGHSPTPLQLLSPRASPPQAAVHSFRWRACRRGGEVSSWPDLQLISGHQPQGEFSSLIRDRFEPLQKQKWSQNDHMPPPNGCVYSLPHLPSMRGVCLSLPPLHPRPHFCAGVPGLVSPAPQHRHSATLAARANH